MGLPRQMADGRWGVRTVACRGGNFPDEPRSQGSVIVFKFAFERGGVLVAGGWLSLASRAAIFAAWCAEEESGGAEPAVSSSSSSIAGYESSGLTGGGRPPALGGGAASNVDCTEDATVLPSSSYSSPIIIVVHAPRGLLLPTFPWRPSPLQLHRLPPNREQNVFLEGSRSGDTLRNKSFRTGIETAGLERSLGSRRTSDEAMVVCRTAKTGKNSGVLEKSSNGKVDNQA